MTLCFLCLSLSCLALVFAMLSLLRTAGGRIGLVLLLCSATGLALAAVFPTDPVNVAPGEASQSARIHGVAVMLGVPTLTVAALLISLPIVDLPTWAAGKLLILGFAHLIWISLVLTIALVTVYLPGSGGFGPEVPERVLLAAGARR